MSPMSHAVSTTTTVPPTVRRGLVHPANCSITATLDALGDSWSIMVLRELFYGVRRFNDIQTDLGISRSVLTNRLARLVTIGVTRTRPYQEPGDRVRNEYWLTRKGVALMPVLIALMEWGDQFLSDGEAPLVLFERESGEEVRLEMRTSSGNRVEPDQIITRATRSRAD